LDFEKVDWDGKLYLIEAAKAANIQKFIFFQNVEQFENIPLMKLKKKMEVKLKESGILYHFQVNWFYQGLIEQYAIPIRKLTYLVTNENTYISYMDTQDIAKFCLRALQTLRPQIRRFFRWIAPGSHQKLLIYANN
jgi:hypothetical protein